MMKRAAEAAGINEDVSPHWLRHAHGSHAIERGASLPQVQQTFGHGNIAFATWSAPTSANHPAAAPRALTIYNLLATVYLAYLGIAGQLVGILLWSAVVLHAVFSVLLGRDWLSADGR